MADLISREALLKELATHFNNVDGRTLYHPSMALAMHDVRNAPAVDAVEVVRCAKCKRCDGFPEKDIEPNEIGICKINMMAVKPDDFCSYGERREENG